LEQRRIKREKIRAEEDLRDAHAELETGSATNAGVGHRQQGLMAEIQQRQRIEREIAAISEREHKRLGMELHDELGNPGRRRSNGEELEAMY